MDASHCFNHFTFICLLRILPGRHLVEMQRKKVSKSSSKERPTYLGLLTELRTEDTMEDPADMQLGPGFLEKGEFSKLPTQSSDMNLQMYEDLLDITV